MKIVITASLLLWLLASFASAQGYTFAQALEARDLPSRIELGKLPVGFRAVQLVVSPPTDTFSLYLPLSMMSSTSPLGAARYEAALAYWTDGRCELIEGQKYLVGYKVEADYAVLSTMERGSGEANPLKPYMNLTLVRMDSITMIMPKPTQTVEWLSGVVSGKFPAPGHQGLAELASEQSRAQSNLKQIALAAIMYATDYDDVYPYVQNTATVKQVTMPYLRSAELWKDPNGGRFLFNMSLAGVGSTTIQVAETVLFYEDKAWLDGTRVVAFADGHTKRVTEQEWQRLKGTLKLKLKRIGRPLPPVKDFG
jgi:hypothetical protein